MIKVNVGRVLNCRGTQIEKLTYEGRYRDICNYVYLRIRAYIKFQTKNAVPQLKIKTVKTSP